MFGFGRRGEIHKLREREHELVETLEQKNVELSDAKGANDQLTSQNRLLTAKVHRLTLKGFQLQEEHDKLMLENRDLQVQTLRMETEAAVAKQTASDAWQVQELKAALRRQAQEHETKMASLKRRTKALLTAVLPGGRSSSGGGAPCPMSVSLHSPDSVASDAPEHLSDSPSRLLPDIWDAPLTPPPASATPDVHAKVRAIIDCLFEDTLSEDQALEQLTQITASLRLADANSRNELVSRGASPVPFPSLPGGGTGSAAAAAGDKVDASTEAEAEFLRPDVADVATETPAELSLRHTEVAATPAETSPRRTLGAVPPLDLASLVAAALESAPLSARSTASTVGGSSSSSAIAASSFILAQPEKLQRLIMRAALTSGANGTPSRQQSGSLFSVAAGGSSTARGPGLPSDASTGMPPLGPANSNSMAARITSRLMSFGAGSGSSTANSNLNRQPSLLSGSTSSSSTTTNAAGVVLPAAASPGKPARSSKPSGPAPKFAVLESHGPGPKSAAGGSGLGLPMGVLKPLSGPAPQGSSGGSPFGGSSNGPAVAGVGKVDLMAGDAFDDLKELGGSSGAGRALVSMPFSSAAR